jgi:hypothetical protein
LVTAVRASIEEQVDLSRTIARHQDLLPGDRFGNEVVPIGDLTFVADVDPCAIPDSLQVQLEEYRVAIEAAVDTIGFDQVVPGY